MEFYLWLIHIALINWRVSLQFSFISPQHSWLPYLNKNTQLNPTLMVQNSPSINIHKYPLHFPLNFKTIITIIIIFNQDLIWVSANLFFPVTLYITPVSVAFVMRRSVIHNVDGLWGPGRIFGVYRSIDWQQHHRIDSWNMIVALPFHLSYSYNISDTNNA